MFKSKNNFLFILLISIVTLVVLVVGAISLYKDNSLIFSSDGYIIETTAEASTKYYFSANTKYKENVDEMITFNDVDDEKRVVDPASFVHYSNGDVMFLKKGALVNLADLNLPMVNYYNITNLSTITYDKGSYVVSSNDNKISIESFIGRISDNKYLVSGSELSLRIPTDDQMIEGEYFELLFIEDGVLKISSDKGDYQVTAQGSYIYIGDNITISLGDGRIMYDGEARMLLSQITINGDENIDLDIDDKNSLGGGGGSGSGSGSGDGDGDGSGDGEGEGTVEGEDGEDGTGGENTGDGTGESGTGGDGSGLGGTGGNSDEVADGTAAPQIELIEAVVTSTTIDLTMQLNNAALAKGNLLYYFTNISTGKREGNSSYIDLVNGTFLISQESLSPSTEYSFVITEVNDDNTEKQYFQKTFRTKDLGITLEKVYATDSSLSYSINFDENTDVSKARISIYDDNGKMVEQTEIARDDLNNNYVFENLKSNTTYAVSIDMIWINNAAYSDVYSINRMDSTLKKTPVISGVDVTANAEEVKFDIKLNSVSDPDKAIVSYVYNVYLADDVTLENPEPTVQYSVTKNDSDNLVLNLNEIDELKTGVDYRAKIFALYDDNEMVREVSTDYSSNFLIRSKPNVSFELKSATMNKVVGTLTLIDPNCTVPINGRTCFSEANTFTLRYYNLEEEETTDNDTTFGFNAKSLTKELTFEDLKSNTTYAVKVFGNYYDDDNVLHTNVQLGDTFYIKTDKSDNIYFEVAGDNKSGYDKDGRENSSNVVNFDARLTAPQDSTISEEISTMTLNLYSGRYNTKDKLIGTYVVTEKQAILDFFSNVTITNSLFTDVTNKKIGLINSLEKLIKVTDNSTGTLNNAYTVEVEDVYDSTGKNKITVENNIYTFHLTPSYYLDARIQTNPNENYITVTPILKESLTEEEYEELSKSVDNLDMLNDDTVVGLIIENSLSDIFVDSAFTYEKVSVNFSIYNTITKNTIKTFNVEMGNKYQPKEQVVWLDSSSYADAKKYFIRGYKYKIGFDLSFTTEDGSNPVYTNNKLYKIVSINRQDPIYTQYISSSNSDGITYSYMFNDIDKAIFDKNFYYTLGEETKYNTIENSLVVDKNSEVFVPVGDNNKYKLYYGRKNTSDEIEYVRIDEYTFEKEVFYDQVNGYEILDYNNSLRIKLNNNVVNTRSHVYKVVIKDKNDHDIGEYVRYFLSSKLGIAPYSTGEFDENGVEIVDTYRYIDIDYANIVKFMGHEMVVEVYAYYDSGLVGINNDKIDYGFILYNSVTNKYLNIYQNAEIKNDKMEISGSEVLVNDNNMGFYFIKNGYEKGASNIHIYNKLLGTKEGIYNHLKGVSYFIGNNFDGNIGVNFDVNFTNQGLSFVNGSKTYDGYNVRVLKEDLINTSNNVFKFNTIVPSIGVTTNNTINSINISITTKGIYGNKQFIKDGKTHNKIYIEMYDDVELTNKLGDDISTDVTINGNEDDGYTATVKSVEFENLVPDKVYYFKVYAYIDGNKTYLYDSSTNTYEVKTYESKTLGAAEILERINFSVNPDSYNGEYGNKKLSWKLNLESTENYKIRFELYKPDGTTTEINPETGEEVVIPLYKVVNFDGSEASSCDINTIGNSDNSYVSGCYISVGRNDVSGINTKTINYTFSNSDFVFGGNYYKLIVYAVPYTNENYNEDQKLVLYQNDSLSTTGTVNGGGYWYDIKIPTLEEPSFTLNSNIEYPFRAGVINDGRIGYFVSFSPRAYDNSKVLSYGKYYVDLKNEKMESVRPLKYGFYSFDTKQVEEIVSSDGKLVLDASNLGDIVYFVGLSSNSLYYVEISYDAYMNNVGLTEEDKRATTPFTDFIYTPIDNNITLGTMTAGQSTSKSVTLTYNGSSNLADNITKVKYTISLKGGSSKTTGEYEIGKNNLANIFTFAADKTPRLKIDVSDSNFSSNTGFSFKSGNTYIISTQYYYMVNGVETRLEDQITHNGTFTTILNL